MNGKHVDYQNQFSNRNYLVDEIYNKNFIHIVHNLLKNRDVEKKTENSIEKNCENYFESHEIYDVIQFYHQK